MKIKPIHKDFKLPEYATKGSAAFDLYAPGKVVLLPNSTTVMKLGFAAAVPEGYVALLLPRSGVGVKKGLGLRNTVGVIDSDYRGEWMAKVTLDNFLELPKHTPNGVFTINKNERVLQCMIVPVNQVEFEVVDNLDETARGEGGWGSTGETQVVKTAHKKRRVVKKKEEVSE